MAISNNHMSEKELYHDILTLWNYNWGENIFKNTTLNSQFRHFRTKNSKKIKKSFFGIWRFQQF
jgi:hypothetical protein